MNWNVFRDLNDREEVLLEKIRKRGRRMLPLFEPLQAVDFEVFYRHDGPWTYCVVRDKKTQVISPGVAKRLTYTPMEDKDNTTIGRNIAFTRAISCEYFRAQRGI